MLTPYRYLALTVVAVLCLLAAYAVGRADGADLVQGRWDKATLVATKAWETERDQLNAKLTAADDKNAHDLRTYQNETNRLRGLLLAGSGGLRIAASCPPTPGPAGSARVDSGAGAELDSTARQSYFALRDGIDRTTAQLAACQEQLKLRIQTTSVDGTQ